MSVNKVAVNVQVTYVQGCSEGFFFKTCERRTTGLQLQLIYRDRGSDVRTSVLTTSPPLRTFDFYFNPVNIWAMQITIWRKYGAIHRDYCTVCFIERQCKNPWVCLWLSYIVSWLDYQVMIRHDKTGNPGFWCIKYRVIGLFLLFTAHSSQTIITVKVISLLVKYDFNPSTVSQWSL